MRLKAPIGTSSFSHAGQSHEVGKDGHIEVPDHIGKVLTESHGFKDPSAPADSPTTAQTAAEKPLAGMIVFVREHVIEMLEYLGVIAHKEISDADLVYALRQAVKEVAASKDEAEEAEGEGDLGGDGAAEKPAGADDGDAAGKTTGTVRHSRARAHRTGT